MHLAATTLNLRTATLHLWQQRSLKRMFSGMSTPPTTLSLPASMKYAWARNRTRVRVDQILVSNALVCCCPRPPHFAPPEGRWVSHPHTTATGTSSARSAGRKDRCTVVAEWLGRFRQGSNPGLGSDSLSPCPLSQVRVVALVHFVLRMKGGGGGGGGVTVFSFTAVCTLQTM